MISVVTASFNQGSYIKQTIDSVLGQDYQDIEYIVIDGSSTDSTLDVLRSYSDHRMTWISEVDNGQSDAINKGMRRASGEILAYLNSDDIYLPGALAFVAQYFSDHPDVDFVHGDCVIIDAGGDEIGLLTGTSFSIESALTKRWRVAQPAAFWRRSVLENIGYFDEKLHYTMDTDYWLRLALQGHKPAYVKRSLAAFRLHDQSKTVSDSLAFMSDWRTMFKKIYTMPNLPMELSSFEAITFTYLDFYSAEALLKQNRRTEARKYLHEILRAGRSIELRVLAVVMLFDSYLGTRTCDALRALYRSAKALRSVGQFSRQ